MKERSILFSAPMVCAILQGRKTQTRRVIKPQPDAAGISDDVLPANPYGYAWRDSGDRVWHCPYGQPGDRLWVRETWQQVHPIQVAEGRYSQDGRAGIPGPPPVDYRTIYRADGEFPPIYSLGGEPWPYRSLEPFERSGITAFVDEPRWNPSIHMPRWASRIDLEVTGVRVERLQDISEADAMAEGVEAVYGGWHVGAAHASALSAQHSFQRLWESINGPGSWDANPWVWAVEFKRVKP